MSENNRFKELLNKTEMGKMTFSQSDRQEVLKAVRGKKKQMPKVKSKSRIPAVFLTTIAAAAILFILIMQSPLRSEIEGAFSKKPSSLFSQSSDPGLVAMSKQNAVSQVNQSSESQGIKVTLKEAVYDGYRMAISYEVQSKTKYAGPVGRPRMKVDGKSVAFSYFDSGIGQLSRDSFLNPTHSYQGTISFVIGKKLPKKFKAELQFLSKIDRPTNLKRNGETKGNWKFSFPVVTKGEVYTLHPNNFVQDGSTTMRIKQITFASSLTELQFSKEEENSRLPAIEGMEYRVMDDKGNLLGTLGNHNGSGEEKDGKFILHEKALYGPVSKIPDYLVLQPFLSNDFEHNPDKNQVTLKSLSDRLPMIFPQKNGSIAVNKIEESKDKKHVKVYYEVKGDLPEIRGSALYLLKGKTIKKDGSNILNDIHHFENVRNAARNKMAEFNTGLQKDLYLAGSYENPVLFKDLELKIPIKKEDLQKK